MIYFSKSQLLLAKTNEDRTAKTNEDQRSQSVRVGPGQSGPGWLILILSMTVERAALRFASLATKDRMVTTLFNIYLPGNIFIFGVDEYVRNTSFQLKR